MNPALLRLLASLKVATWAAAGCVGTVVVQHYTASSSSSWDEKAATEKEVSGKGIKFEISQLSKQLEEKEQSLKTWEELLAKKDADLKERLAEVSQTQTTTVVKTTTVADVKPDQPVIDDVSFGEDASKNGKSKNSKIVQRGIAKQAAEEPTVDVPKRPAVFDGGGSPAVAFPPMTDVVTVKEGGEVPAALEAELRAKDRALEVLRKQREEAWKAKEADLAKYEAELRRLEEQKDALKAELTKKDQQLAKLSIPNEDLERKLEEKDRRLTELNAFNEDLKRKLVATKEKLSKAEAKAKGQMEDIKEMKKKMAMLPENGSFAVCRFKPKEVSKLWYFCSPMVKWKLDACQDKCCGVLINDMVRDKEVGLSELEECYIMVPFALYVCATTSDPEGGLVVKNGKDRYSVRPQSRGWLCWLFCPCKKRAKEIRKLKYEEAVIKVKSEESQDPPKRRELFKVLSTEENKIFELKEKEIGTDGWTSLAVPEDAKSKDAYSVRGLFYCIFCPCKKRVNKKHKGTMSEFGDKLLKEKNEIFENEIRTNGRMPLAGEAFEPNKDDASLSANGNHFREIRASLENGSLESLWQDGAEIVVSTNEVSSNSNETSAEGPSKSLFWKVLHFFWK